MRVILVAVSCCLALVTAVPRNSQRIIGGSATTVNEYPEIVPLLYSNSGSSYYQACAGTILNVRSILTAAHCVAGDSAFQWRFRAGSSYSSSGGTVYSIGSIVYHADFSKPIDHDNDIAILRTSSNIIYTSVVKAATIAGTNYNLADSQVLWAAGWGSTSEEEIDIIPYKNIGGSNVDLLRHVQIWAINADACKSRYSQAGYTVTDNMLCSGWLDVGGRDQSQGDSGGPLFHNGVVVGIYSWGSSVPCLNTLG